MVLSQHSFKEKLAGESSLLCAAFPVGPAAGPPRPSHAALRSDQHRHRPLPGLPAGRGGALPGGGAGQPRSDFTTRRQPSGPELLPMVSHLVVCLKEPCSDTQGYAIYHHECQFVDFLGFSFPFKFFQLHYIIGVERLCQQNI